MPEAISISPIKWMGLLYHKANPPRKAQVEFRFLKGGQRYWMPYFTYENHPDAFTLDKAPAGTQVYFGISLRTEEGRQKNKGGIDDVHPTHLVWVDVDLKDTPFLQGETKPETWTAEDIRKAAEECWEWVQSKLAEHNLNMRAAVYTGHGLQIYFARTVRTTKEDTRRFNGKLVHLLGGDRTGVEVARIFRVPGSKHLKNPKRPLPVELWHADAEATVHDKQLEALPDPPEPPKPAPTPPTGTVEPANTQTPVPTPESEGYTPPADTSEVIRKYNERVSIHDLLTQYGYRRESDTRYTRPGDGASGNDVHILPCGYKNILGSFHHSSNDPMHSDETRDPFSLFCQWEHNGDAKKAVAAAAKFLGIDHASNRPKNAGLKARTKVPGQAKDRTPQTKEAEPEEDTPPVPRIYMDHGSYWIDRPKKSKGEIVGWIPEQLTNWTWVPERKLVFPDGTLGEEGTLWINERPNEGVQLPSLAWRSRKDLLEAIGGYQAVIFTTDNKDIALIQQYVITLYTDLPRAHGVQSYGLHLHDGEWLEIFEDRVLSKKEQPPVFYAGTPVDPQSVKHQAPRVATEEQVEQARSGIIRLPDVITPTTALAQLGYAAASAFSPRITSSLGNRLPFLYIAGERESGKTSGAQIVLEMASGNTSRISKAHSMTRYQYDLAHSRMNNMLALLDEYRPGEIDDSHLRDHHDLGVHWRGSGKAMVNHSYPLNSPLIVLGEGLSDDAATKSRGVIYFTKKKDRANLQEYTTLLGLPIWAYASHLHHCARTFTDDQVQNLLTRAHIQVKTTTDSAAVSPRLIYALTFIAFGLFFLQDDVSKETFSADAIAGCLKAGIDNTLEGENEGETNLEIFLEQLGFALSKHPNPWLFVSAGASQGTLILRKAQCVELVRSQYREKAAISSKRLLGQYAEQADFIDSKETHKDYQNRTVRGIKLLIDKAPDRSDLSILSDLEERDRERKVMVPDV